MNKNKNEYVIHIRNFKKALTYELVLKKSAWSY